MGNRMSNFELLIWLKVDAGKRARFAVAQGIAFLHGSGAAWLKDPSSPCLRARPGYSPHGRRHVVVVG